MEQDNQVKVIEIAFTGYSVTDLKRARNFYEGSLGLEVSRVFGDEENAWVEYDIGLGTISIGNMMPGWKPGTQGGIVGLEVDDFDQAVAKVKADGVRFIHDTIETPVCRMVTVLDPDGNAITIHKRKPGHS